MDKITLRSGLGPAGFFSLYITFSYIFGVGLGFNMIKTVIKNPSSKPEP